MGRSMIETIDARGLARRLAATGLPYADEPFEIARPVWHRFLTTLKVERMTGLASAAAAADVLVLTNEQRAELHAAQLEAMTWTVALERALLEIALAGKADDLAFIVLKGPALAHNFYPDPSWRAFADIDLLVQTRDWRRACALLERNGFRREKPEPRAGFDERFGKAAVHVGPHGLSVDLHRTLVLGPFGLWMEPEELFEHTVPFDLAGVPLRRLDDTALLLHACVHAALGFMDPLLLPVRDVVQITQQGAIDWPQLGRWAERWRLRGVVLHAFKLANDILDFPPPEELAVLGPEPVARRERRALDAYITGRRSRGGTIRSALSALPRVRDKLALLRAMLVPERAFLAARTERGARPSYLRRWAVPVRWLMRRTR